jgi:hypothetical protein
LRVLGTARSRTEFLQVHSELCEYVAEDNSGEDLAQLDNRSRHKIKSYLEMSEDLLHVMIKLNGDNKMRQYFDQYGNNNNNS